MHDDVPSPLPFFFFSQQLIGRQPYVCVVSNKYDRNYCRREARVIIFFVCVFYFYFQIFILILDGILDWDFRRDFSEGWG